ncbi:Hypothetical protein, putative [Bodo saltans]|uniref:Membrane-associated protein n=1 Tax=Bodo saltans TaxID=75058 RepID=A0A0S4JV82_BODSA|nr:Hypothetical protein, putative [Bodo saltans]|eukprot:CUG93951.1 Hypothetical protein, putative [Bodo saltans]
MLKYFSITTVLTLAVLFCASNAQLEFDAPLMPEYTYTPQGAQDGSIVGAVAVGNFGFSADASFVWGLNLNIPPNLQTPFQDPLTGVTQMWAWCADWNEVNTCRLHVIAGPTLVMYSMNATNVWRAATLTEPSNATFDIATSSPSGGFPNLYPTILSWDDGSRAIFVQGTSTASNKQRSVTVTAPSIVYAFDTQDLTIVWTTTTDSDTSNFATLNCSDYVWIITQNQSSSYSNTVVRKIHPNNGTLLDWAFSTHFPAAYQIMGISNGQFMVVGIGEYSGGSLTLAFNNGTLMSLGYDIGWCSTLPIPPTLIGSTWYAICGDAIQMWDSQTGTPLATSPFTTSSSTGVQCALANSQGTQMMFSDGVTLYNANSYGMSMESTLPGSVGGYSIRCTGMGFSTKNDSVVYVSFQSEDAGSVIAFEFNTGIALFQAAASLSPIGPAVDDLLHNGILVASATTNNALQGYQFVPRNNATSFTSFMPETEESVAIAMNPATPQVVYYISSSSLYAIDVANGNYERLATNLTIGTEVSLFPIFVGQFLVFFSANYNADVYVFDIVNNMLATVSLTDANFNSDVQPVVFGTKFVIFAEICNSANIAAMVVDVADTSKIQNIPSDSLCIVSGATVVNNEVLVIITGTSSITGYNQTSLTTPVFHVSSATDPFNTISSAPVSYGDYVYFPALWNHTSAEAIFRITASNGVTEVVLPAVLGGQVSSLLIADIPAIKCPTLYVFSGLEIVAYTIAGWNRTFVSATPNGVYSPQVFSSGVISFYAPGNSTFSNMFTLLRPNGEVAWTYNVSTICKLPVVTDGGSVYFSDSLNVVGADMESGAVLSRSTFGLASLMNFDIQRDSTANVTTLVGTSDNEVVFATSVGSTRGH